MELQIESIKTEQLAEMLQLSDDQARQVMREIKSVSDTFGFKGICHKQDYEMWKAVRRGQPAK